MSLLSDYDLPPLRQVLSVVRPRDAEGALGAAGTVENVERRGRGPTGSSVRILLGV